MARYKAVILAYLPNKSAQGRPASGWRIGFLVFFILLIFAGWFYFSDYKNKQTQFIAEKEKSPLAVALDTTSQLDADSDADGLKDWEELLWKTDPNKTDTDGDGTNDNEEITLNRNPLKAGPDDKISEKEDLVAQEKVASDSKQNTLTAAYARKFLTDYLILKKQKGELSELDKESLVQSFMDSLEPLTVNDTYNISNIKISNDISEASVRKYASEMKKIFVDDQYILINGSDIFNILFKNIQEENAKNIELSVQTLNYYSFWNEKLAKTILALTVPKNFSKNQLETINGFNNLKFAIENMTTAQTDPVKAMMGQKLYDEQIQRIYNALKNIQEIFNEYEITIFK